MRNNVGNEGRENRKGGELMNMLMIECSEGYKSN